MNCEADLEQAAWRFARLSRFHGITPDAVVRKGSEYRQALSLALGLWRVQGKGDCESFLQANPWLDADSRQLLKVVGDGCDVSDLHARETFFSRVGQISQQLEAEALERRRAMQEKNRRVNAPRSLLPTRSHASEIMQIALEQARQGLVAGEVPVGAVLEVDGQVVSRAHNRVILDRDPTAHAEILAIRSACRSIGSERLSRAVLYVTLEPCPMCATAISLARVSAVVFGASDPQRGGMGGRGEVSSDYGLNHRSEVLGGVMQVECAELLTDFFMQKRGHGND